MSTKAKVSHHNGTFLETMRKSVQMLTSHKGSITLDIEMSTKAVDDIINHIHMYFVLLPNAKHVTLSYRTYAMLIEAADKQRLPIEMKKDGNKKTYYYKGKEIRTDHT